VCSGVLPLCITPDSLSGLHFTVVCAVQWDTPITDDAGGLLLIECKYDRTLSSRFNEP
jgi:hypothetical protein